MVISGGIEIKKSINGEISKPTTVYVRELIFDTIENFPSVGDSKCLYIAIDETENSIYRWDSETEKYILLTSKGTIDYEDLVNLPKLNGIEIIGDKTNEEYKIEALSNLEIEKLLKGE